jgi:hypothetical protein
MAGRPPPLPWRLDARRHSGGSFRHGELAAALATGAIAGQLVFAQAALVNAAVLVAIGRVSRWRPHWLAIPGAASVVWLLVIGPARAAAGLAAGSHRLAYYLLAAAVHPRLLAHPGIAAAGLTRGLPLALLAGCGEAWIVLWLGWWRPGARMQSGWLWRSGLVAAIRRRISAATLAAGRTVTTDGCAVGLATDTGKLAGFTWSEASRGVLLTGQAVEDLGLAIACAALRRRKTVVTLECADQAAETAAPVGRAAVAARIAEIARSLGVPVTDAGASVAGTIGRAIRSRETVLVETESEAAARLAAADLTAVLSGLRDLGLRTDCLAWINGFELIDPASLTELLDLGQLTGTVIVLSTASSAHAAKLASTVAVAAVGQPAGADVVLALADRMRGTDTAEDAGLAAIATPRSGEIAALVFTAGRDGSPPAVRNCRVLPIALAHSR